MFRADRFKGSGFKGSGLRGLEVLRFEIISNQGIDISALMRKLLET